MGRAELVRFDSAEKLANAVAKEWLGEVARTPRQCCAFSGGRIAEKFFEALRALSPALNNVHFFWADERCVPPDHPDSNYRLMHTRLLGPLKIPEGQVHRIRGEAPPAVAAAEASEQFARIVRPALDFVFLGMGEDGHVASIFPGDNAEESPSVYYRPVIGPKPPPQRITLGMHAIQAAQNVWVLASGPGKEAALGKSLGPEANTPLGKVIGGRSFTRIFTEIPAK